MQEKLSERVPVFPLAEALAPKQGEEIEGDLSTLGNLIPDEPSKHEAPAEDKINPMVEELQVRLEEAQAKLEALQANEQPIQDQEIRSSIEQPKGLEPDVAIERQPVPPTRLRAPGKADQAECVVMHEANPSDAMARYRSTIRDLLATLSTIAGATARPSDELSAIAQHAIVKHSKTLNNGNS